MDKTDQRVGSELGGRYRILDRLSAGGMGVVYRAERLKLERTVAIKFLNAEYAATDAGKRLFELEAVASSRLSHPNCVPVIDFGVEGDEPFLVMEFVEGRDLRAVLDDVGSMPPARAVDLTRKILAGLAHAHGQGVIHRDIKPENIMLTKVQGHGEQPRVLDFGLGKLRGKRSVLSGLAPATPSYISPELTRGLKVDERADIYAVGIILYELITGQKPFNSKVLGELLRMHREAAPPPIRKIAPDVAISEELELAIQRALAKEREERFPTAEAFSEALEATAEAKGEPDTPPPTRRRNPAPFIAIGAAVAGAALWAILF